MMSRGRLLRKAQERQSNKNVAVEDKKKSTSTPEMIKYVNTARLVQIQSTLPGLANLFRVHTSAFILVKVPQK